MTVDDVNGPITRETIRVDDRLPIPERHRLMRTLAEEATREPIVQKLSRQIFGRDAREIAAAALAATQQLGYRPPQSPGDYYAPALATVAGGGDCKALAIVLVALLSLQGQEAMFVWLPNPDPGARAHVTVAVRLDGAWQWAEPCVNARLGEHPYDAARRLNARVIGLA